MRPLKKLFNYQKSAVKLMLNRPYCALFLDAGLGKTASVLVAVKRLMTHHGCKKVLVIAPLLVVQKVWKQEAECWEYTNDLTFSLLHGKNKDVRFNDNTDVHLINFEGLLWLADKIRKAKRVPYDILIIDESSKMKSPSSQRFKRFKSLFGQFKRRYILSATPMPNEVKEIWSQWYVLDQGRLLGDTYTSFENKYYQAIKRLPTGFMLKKPLPNAGREVAELIAPHSIRMDAEDHISMPEIKYNNIYVDLPKKVLKVYKDLLEGLVVELGEDHIVPKTAGIMSLKLRQVLQGAVYTEAGTIEWYHRKKAEALKDLVESHDKPILVAVGFRFDSIVISEVLGYDVPTIDGNTTLEDKNRYIEQWNVKKLKVLLCNPKSIGHGVNLQHGSNIIVWYTLTWSNEDYIQFNARLKRTGQKERFVIVHHLVVDNTKDVDIQKALENKELNQQKIFDILKGNES